MKLTGAQALIKSLEMQGVDVMFGLPGGAILPVYDPIIDSSIRHILVRHEQGAGHMAEGYAMVTGRPGVAMVTSGPGATNIVTPLANAYMDSTPLVVVSGQVATASIGTDAFQECDITGVTMGITKHNWLIKNVDDIPRVVAAAFHVATTGRPGPVLIDLPKDISNATMEWYWPSSVDELDLPGYHPVTFGDPVLVRQAAELIAPAHRPVFYVGGGVLKARAAEQLRTLAERTGIPVVTTLMARGAFPDSHPQALGMPGMHGHYTAVTALQKSDLLISLGARFDDRVTGKISAFAPEAKVIHVDIDPAELGKVRVPDVGIAGDCRQVIEELLLAMDARGDAPVVQDLAPWWAPDPRLAGALPALLRRDRRRRHQAAERGRAAARRRPRGRDRGGRSGTAPDVGLPVLGVQPSLHLGQLGRRGHHGLRRAGGHRGQGRAPRADGLGHRRRRLLPDDGPGVGDGQRGADPGEDRHPQQRLPRHGAPVAGDVLRASATRRSTSRPTCPTTSSGPKPWGASASGPSRPKTSGPPLRRPTASTTARSWSTSAPMPSRRCSRWCRPARRTTTSSSIPSRLAR